MTDKVLKQITTTDSAIIALKQYPVTELSNILKTLATDANNNFYVILATNRNTLLINKQQVHTYLDTIQFHTSNFITGYLIVTVVENRLFNLSKQIDLQLVKTKDDNRYTQEQVNITISELQESIPLLSIYRRPLKHSLVLIPNRQIYNFTLIHRGPKTLRKADAKLISYETDYCNLQKINALFPESITLIDSNIAYILEKEDNKKLEHSIAVTDKRTFAKLNDHIIIPEPIYLLSDLLANKDYEEDAINTSQNQTVIDDNLSTNELLTTLTDLSDLHGTSELTDIIVEQEEEIKEKQFFDTMTLDTLTDLVLAKTNVTRATIIYDIPNLLPESIECLLIQNRVLRLYSNVYLVTLPKQ